jgi:hypothetical protein
MATDSGVGKNMSRKDSGTIKRQGQTESVFGSATGIGPKNGAGAPVKDLRP